MDHSTSPLQSHLAASPDSAEGRNSRINMEQSPCRLSSHRVEVDLIEMVSRVVVSRDVLLILILRTQYPGHIPYQT